MRVKYFNNDRWLYLFFYPAGNKVSFSMIGPHQGKELELMLAGKKPLAVFHDAVPGSGVISEGIIPEQAFAPYVASGKIIRFSEDIVAYKDGTLIRFVCFATPGEQWRAEFFLWLKRETFSGRIVYDPAQEYIIGGLLGYSTGDIAHFIEHRKQAG